MRYMVTFGQQYAREPHPTCPGAHPDGYLEVEAPDELTARGLVVDAIGSRWSFMYSETEWDAESMSDGMFPRGCLGTVTADAGLRTR